MASLSQLSDTATHHQYILRTLMYFDIFSYPLTAPEVHSFLGQNGVTAKETAQILNDLVAENQVYKLNQYYAIKNEPTLVKRRELGNERAVKRMKMAKRISRFIGNFPFVRAVGLSGSLSKNYMDEKSDIDFFIITAPGRLWVTRMFLITFKKLFLFNSYKFFCINYLITTGNLEIEDKNVFTATELVTLIPTYGAKELGAFYQANPWAWEFLPNAAKRPLDEVPQSRRRGLKWFSESILSGKIGDKLDQRFLNITLKVWKKKFGYLPPQEFNHAFRTREDVSKHHPSNFQRKVLDALEERVRQFESAQTTTVQSN